MAPPDRDNSPRRPENIDYLEKSDLAGNPVLGDNAARLASWVEWLLHPEEHDHDRTVIYPDGTKREEEGPVYRDQSGDYPRDVQDLDYESVIEGYRLWQFLNFMTAVSTQQVERSDSVLAPAGFAANNLYYVADTYETVLLVGFPDEQWHGSAKVAAKEFLKRLSPAANQLTKIGEILGALIPRYAVVIKELRRNLDQTAAELVRAFEDKFYNRNPDISIDVVGAAIAGIAGAAIVVASGGFGAGVGAAAITAAWSTMFTDAANKLVKNQHQGSVHGSTWRSLVESYMHTQAQIMAAATKEIQELNGKVKRLLEEFHTAPMPTGRLPEAGNDAKH